MEAKNFIGGDDFDITPLKGRIKYCVVRKSNYNFLLASASSRINVSFSTMDNSQGDFQASKENCDVLKSITIQYFKTNLIG